MNQRKLKRNAQKARAAATRMEHHRAAERDATGRVHLALHRDPTSGESYLTLTQPVFNESWQNDLAAGTANTAVALLGGQPNFERTVELAKNAMAAASRISDVLLARAPNGAVACKAECDHCCYQSVGVTPPEALAIFDHLQRTRSGPELASITRHISERHQKTNDLSASERYSPDQPCPFLEAGRCSIYEVRPLACRGMNSLDAEDCAKRLRDPEARAAFLASGRGGYSFMEPIRAFHAISAGLQLSLAELYHLDMRPLELTAAMQLLLSGPESSAAEWLGGQTTFAAAVRNDSATEPGLREMSGVLKPA